MEWLCCDCGEQPVLGCINNGGTINFRVIYDYVSEILNSRN